MNVVDKSRRKVSLKSLAYGCPCEFEGKLCVATNDRRDHVHILMEMRTGKLIPAPKNGDVYIIPGKFVKEPEKALRECPECASSDITLQETTYDSNDHTARLDKNCISCGYEWSQYVN